MLVYQRVLICGIYPSEISCCLRPNSTWQAQCQPITESGAPGVIKHGNGRIQIYRCGFLLTSPYMEGCSILRLITRGYYVHIYIYIYVIHMRRTPSYMYANRDIHVAHCSTNYKDAKLIRTYLIISLYTTGFCQYLLQVDIFTLQYLENHPTNRKWWT